MNGCVYFPNTFQLTASSLSQISPFDLGSSISDINFQQKSTWRWNHQLFTQVQCATSFGRIFLSSCLTQDTPQ